MAKKKEPRKKDRSRLWKIEITLGDCPDEGWGFLRINTVRTRLEHAIERLVDNHGAYILRKSLKLSYDNKKAIHAK